MESADGANPHLQRSPVLHQVSGVAPDGLLHTARLRSGVLRDWVVHWNGEIQIFDVEQAVPVAAPGSFPPALAEG